MLKGNLLLEIENAGKGMVRWYGDGAGKTGEENYSVFSLIRMCYLPCWQ